MLHEQLLTKRARVAKIDLDAPIERSVRLPSERKKSPNSGSKTFAGLGKSLLQDFSSSTGRIFTIRPQKLSK